MNLIIDIGNSQTKLAIIQDEKIVLNQRFQELNCTHLSDVFNKNDQICNAIISSVAKIDPDIQECIKSKVQQFLYLNSKTPLPVEVLYKSRETLGNDRIAAVVGANNIFPSSNVLVIDAGTAITFDFINNKNQYLGGNISPGLRMRYSALNYYTNRLPQLEPADEEMLTGDNTNNAIISGVQKGMIFEIDSYIEAYKKKHPDCNFIITGGDAIFFDKKLKSSIFVNLNLVILGLNRIMEYNAE